MHDDSTYKYRSAKTLTRTAPPTPSEPVTITFMAFDVDGTCTPTYIVLECLPLLSTFFADKLGNGSNQAAIFCELATIVRERNTIGSLLHTPEELLLSVAHQYAKNVHLELSGREGRDFSIDDISGIRRTIDRCFQAAPGVIRTFKAAHDAGTRTAIFTDSNIDNALTRLQRAKIPFQHIDIIYAPDTPNAAAVLNAWREAHPDICLPKIVLCDGKKPHGQPMHDAIRDGTDPHTIALIGENILDMRSVHTEDGNIGWFFLQKPGALRAGRTQPINRMLRVHPHDLGLETFPDGDLEHPHVIHLERGFATFRQMMRKGSVIFGKYTPS